MSSYIIGTVVDTRKGNATLVTSGGNEYNCSYDIFCPMQIRDIFAGMVDVIDPNRKTLFMSKPPKISMPIDDESIILCLDKRYSTNRLTAAQREKSWTILDSLTSLSSGTGDIESKREDLICGLSESWRNKLKTGGNIELLFTPSESYKFGQWWYKNRTLRSLYLLGFNNKDIRDSYLSPRELYKRTASNPYRVPTISLLKCRDLIEQLDLNLTEVDEYCGRIVRTLYSNMRDRSWTCTPLKKMTTTYHGLQDLLPHLDKNYGVRLYNDHLYLEDAFDAEEHIASWVKEMGGVRDVEVEVNERLDEVQKRGVELALRQRLSIITGGPGTGKTTIIKEILKNLAAYNIQCDIVSFTGKAVARVREVTGYTRSFTLHQLIATSSQDRVVEHLIIDECSMVPLDLFSRFIKRFNPISVTLIGDSHQLEPISWGSLFSQLLEVPSIPKVTLETVYRTNSEALLNNLNAIRRGDSKIELEQGVGFMNLPGGIAEVLAVLTSFKNSGVPSSSMSVITPYNRDVLEINKICQELYTEGRSSIVDYKRILYREGDRVMLTENRYDINIMNGEEGTISKILPGAIEVDFGHGKIHTFPTSPASNDTVSTTDRPGELLDQEPLSTGLLTLSYSITVHKSQGSEYENVILLIPKSEANKNFLTRNLMYTGISRAKSSIFLVGSVREIEDSIVTPRHHRNEQLAFRLS